jgi:hypothetical protein
MPCLNKHNQEQMETDDAHQTIASLNQTLQESKTLAKITADHKELHAPISKLGKVIDKVWHLTAPICIFMHLKSFRADIEKASRQIKFDNHLLDEVIAQHLYRQGRFELGDMYSEVGNQITCMFLMRERPHT